ncbi:hypothetical protein [Micromonospora psammae]|uniref:hypothetical protein n=1 Tax=Micromonospora sp. CPCC 205556 TaxID=3122398 RepID=UPI002FF311F1
MRADEFLRALELLPAPLHERAAALRAYARQTRCDDCQRIGDAVRLALTAAHYDELAPTAQLLDSADQQATEHGSACRPEPNEQQAGRGRVNRWAAASAALVAATDASWKGRAGGIGYVVSDGHYGLRSRSTGRLDPTGCRAS